MVEYALLVALVALIAIPSVGMLGGAVDDSFDKAKAQVAGAGSFPMCPESDPDCN